MKQYIIGNWKMQGDEKFVSTLLSEILTQSESLSPAVELIVLPPTIFLPQVKQFLQNTRIAWGAQNVSEFAPGAYTGEIAGEMLIEQGCQFVLVGHSERRTVFKETDLQIAQKYLRAVQLGLQPILCVGETLTERQSGQTMDRIYQQLSTVFTQNLLPQTRVIVAYEPVWAIGTGVAAMPDEVQAVHAKVRAWFAESKINHVKELSILYGGSIKVDNARQLLALPDVNGGLIGGASLKSRDFLGIATCSNLC